MATANLSIKPKRQGSLKDFQLEGLPRTAFNPAEREAREAWEITQPTKQTEQDLEPGSIKIPGHIHPFSQI